MSGLVLKPVNTVDPVTKQVLLPCPFCGGKAEVEEVKVYNGAAFSVGCTDNEGGGLLWLSIFHDILAAE